MRAGQGQAFPTSRAAGRTMLGTRSRSRRTSALSGSSSRKYVAEALLSATNKNLKTKLTLREFYVFLGCQFFMACFDGITSRKLWWSEKPVSMFDGVPFRLNKYMSGARFEDIISALRYTDEKPPAEFVDRFHPIRKLMSWWNQHYAEEYSPSCLNYLDESMNAFFNHLCAGFMRVPHKPHPFGNEYHAISVGVFPGGARPVIRRAKIQESKDRPTKDGGGRSHWILRYRRSRTSRPPC